MEDMNDLLENLAALAEQATYKLFVEEKAKKNGDKPAIIFGDERISYAELNERVNRVSNALAEIGIEKGDKVCLMLANSPEYIYAWLGASKRGMVSVFLNTSLKGDGLAYIINHCDAETMIISHRHFDAYNRVKGDLRNIKRLIVDTRGAPGEFSLPPGSVPYQQLFNGSPEDPDVEVLSTDMESINYTSGTTGLPKGVVYRQRRAAVAAVAPLLLQYEPNETAYCCLPLFHIGGRIADFWQPFGADAAVVLADRFSASRYWDDIRRYGCTRTTFLGAMIPILLKQPRRDDDADNPMKIAFTAAAPGNMWQEFEERFGVKIMEIFSQTEGGALLNLPGGKPGAMGVALDPERASATILDENDNECSPGVVGELVFRSQDPSDLPEYYKNPEATEEKTRGGWLRTGDLAYRDEEGYFFFVDRKNDCMRRRGENISSYEVEKIVNKHPKVDICAAYGVPSELAEDDVMVAVVVKPGETLAPEELIRFCEEEMAYFMVPRYVRFVESLSMTVASHRVQKVELRQQGITEDTWDRDKAGYKLKR